MFRLKEPGPERQVPCEFVRGYHGQPTEKANKCNPLSDWVEVPVFLRVPSPFFGGSFFLENHQKPWGNGWFLKRTMADKNGELTPRVFLCRNLPTILGRAATWNLVSRNIPRKKQTHLARRHPPTMQQESLDFSRFWARPNGDSSKTAQLLQTVLVQTSLKILWREP